MIECLYADNGVACKIWFAKYYSEEFAFWVHIIGAILMLSFAYWFSKRVVGKKNIKEE